MFANFLYILSALLIFSTYSPSLEYTFSLLDLLLLLVPFLLFSRLVSMRLKVLDEPIGAGFLGLKLQERYLGISTFLMTFSVFLFFGTVYFLHLKEMIIAVTRLPDFPFLQELLGICYFFGFFTVYWRKSHSYYARIFNSTLSKDEYVRSQFKFNVPILAPWFLISSLFAVTELFLERFGIAVSQNYKDFIVLPAFFIVTAVFLPVIIKKMWSCKPFGDSEQHRELDAFCRSQGLRFQSLLEWNVFEGKMFTAGIMGLVPRFRYILITPIMLSSLTMEELKAVLAHEIGHNKNHHMTFYLLFFLGFLLISITYPDLLFLFLASLGSFQPDWFLDFLEQGSEYFSLVWVTIPIILLMILYFRVLYGIFSRAFEREADIHSILTMGNGDGIISSLEKIGIYSGNIRDMPNWHHYSIRERVDFIRECCNDPQAIVRHKKKVLFLKIGYLVFLGCMIALTVYTKTLNPENDLKFAILEKALHREIEEGRGTLELHLTLGNIYLERKEFFKAEEQLLAAREFDRYNVEVLNNLAWLYVTSEEPALRKYETALNLGLMALALKREAFLLDTVAECYYKLGDIERAIELEEEALSMADENIEFYESQLEKFKRVLGQGSRVQGTDAKVQD